MSPGAEFSLDNKAISYEKALNFLKENKQLSIKVEENNGEKPQVKLSTKPIKHEN
ncbi:hypothetical protein GCM10007383_20370 [Arenibacter certesii]|uniref:Uncharacterized protein n=1 Tax=Arenibacter certesii TaxID=228955 RepID=A0A918MLR5_9FLAO|nr:hypothetical protein GCM10007383_20370 [Arenibacter certesii]